MPEPPNRSTDPASKTPLVDEPVNQARVALYARLMEAQERIAHNRYARGVSSREVAAALDAADERLTEDEQRQDLFLASLAHYVTALGGRLEVRAVFDDQEILVRRDPGD